MTEARCVVADLFVRANATFTEATTVLAALGRARELEAFLRELVAKAPVSREVDGWWRCGYCGMESPYSATREGMAHTDDCLIVKARTLLEQKGGG
jgi:hypothetical protein